MERDGSSATLDHSSRGPLEEPDGQPHAVEDPGLLESYDLVTARCRGPCGKDVTLTRGPEWLGRSLGAS